MSIRKKRRDRPDSIVPPNIIWAKIKIPDYWLYGRDNW
ncbi:hypothetical protein SPLC1_S171390 [Arthrospira platensis C1]|nr:hypothetical protein SPLC1_S171390 [Arthrospira platensis C1]